MTEPEGARQVRDAYLDRRGEPPRVVARAPGRVNIIGEHTDHSGGLCLPLALDLSTWVGVGPAHGASDTVASDLEDGVVHHDPATQRVGGWSAYVAGVLWAVRRTCEVPPVHVEVVGKVPVGAGLSSSAALTCATAVAVHAWTGGRLDEAVRDALVEIAVAAESVYVGAPTGGMDQAVALHGVPGTALLLDFATGTREPVPCTPDEDGFVLLVLDTRTRHTHTTGEYGDRRALCASAAALLGVPHLSAAAGLPSSALAGLPGPERAAARHVLGENARVRATVDCLAVRDWHGVGMLLTASHASLRDELKVSCPELDLAVATADRAGALGARMTGGGFGGCALALVPKGRSADVEQAVTEAFAAAGHRPPHVFPVVPGARAEVVLAPGPGPT
ncbi:MAG: galactokinase family protein [Nocardioides sp.]|nr:galactokinase family protein [Nocardioides sp.]